ncbi:hypothetical protein, partial [Bifidobacterium adolescentis]|uniref:hypothetical protein n=1 Tax=Bifidobacterium adolescentis TaxID=1680 RepID=UPI0022DEC110
APFRFRSIPRMSGFTILPEIMTETRDATLSSPLIHTRTVIHAERMRKPNPLVKILCIVGRAWVSPSI